MDQAHPARRQGRPLWHARPQGDGLPHRVRGEGDEAGQVAAERRQGVRLHLQAARERRDEEGSTGGSEREFFL